MSVPDRRTHQTSRSNGAKTHLGFHGDLFTISPAESVLGHQVLERLHDGSGLGLLVVGEDAGDGDDSSEDNSEVEIVIWGLLVGRGLDTVGHEAEDGSDPEQTSEAREKILAKFYPLWGGGRRGEGVRSVLSQRPLGLSISQATLDVSLEPLAKLLDWNFVNIKLQLLLQLIEVSLLGCGPPSHVVSRPVLDGVSQLWARPGLISSVQATRSSRIFPPPAFIFVVLHSVDAFRRQPPQKGSFFTRVT